MHYHQLLSKLLICKQRGIPPKDLTFPTAGGGLHKRPYRSRLEHLDSMANTTRVEEGVELTGKVSSSLNENLNCLGCESVIAQDGEEGTSIRNLLRAL